MELGFEVKNLNDDRYDYLIDYDSWKGGWR